MWQLPQWSNHRQKASIPLQIPLWGAAPYGRVIMQMSRSTVLYRLHGRAILSYLVRLTLGDHRQAEDILQETFVRAWRYLKDHPLDTETLWPWLYTVARRLVIDALRAHKARPHEVIVIGFALLLGPATEDMRAASGRPNRPGCPDGAAAAASLCNWSSSIFTAGRRTRSPNCWHPFGHGQRTTHYALQALRELSYQDRLIRKELSCRSPAAL